MNPVCLITPPSGFLSDERVFPSLGILRVAACLEREGYPVEHLDLSGIENFVEAAADHASRSEAIVFGLTATTPQMPATTKIVTALRECRPDARLILGGPHVTLVNAARKREATEGRAHRAFAELTAMFDVLVAGDGDDAVFGALSPYPPKLIDADDVKSPLFLSDRRYELIPFPARHLVDMTSYHYSIEGVPAAHLIGQLGCPYQCSFCGGRNSAMLRRIRTRSVRSIISEVLHLHKRYGYRGFNFFDDELNVSRSMIELMDRLTDAQKALGVKFRLRGFIKSNLFTDAQAEAMYRAGFRWILVGFESGSPRILENIQKKATREQNSECMAIARRHGLKVKALMSLGHAGETRGTILQTHEWLIQERPDDFDATVISTYPGTAYYDDARETYPGVWTYMAKNGDTLHSYEVDFNAVADYYKGLVGKYKSYVFTDDLVAEEIVELRDWLERDVREQLRIPFNPSAPCVRYEASIGQLPGYMLRQTTEVPRMRQTADLTR